MKKLLYNAVFHSMNENNDLYSALLIENDTIVDTYPLLKQQADFSDLKPDNLPSGDYQKINLNSAHVYPAFTDTHTHSFEGGLYSKGTDCSFVKSISELLALLEASSPIANMIIAWNYDENSVIEHRFPTLKELDHICPDKPLLLRRVDGHSCVINSQALKRINWKYNVPNDFNGLLKGDLNDNAAHWFHKNLDPEAIISCYLEAEKIAVKNGHARIHTMIGDAKDDILHFKIMKDNLDQFNIDYLLYPQSFNINKALEVNSPRIGGCILADGSFGSHTAALF